MCHPRDYHWTRKEQTKGVGGGGGGGFRELKGERREGRQKSHGADARKEKPAELDGPGDVFHP